MLARKMCHVDKCWYSAGLVLLFMLLHSIGSEIHQENGRRFVSMVTDQNFSKREPNRSAVIALCDCCSFINVVSKRTRVKENTIWFYVCKHDNQVMYLWQRISMNENELPTEIELSFRTAFREIEISSLRQKQGEIKATSRN